MELATSAEVVLKCISNEINLFEKSFTFGPFTFPIFTLLYYFIVLFEIRIGQDWKESIRKGSSDVIFTLAQWPETTFLS